MLHYLFIHAWNHLYTINAVSSSVVVTCTLERILFLDFKLGLAVTEIINFQIKSILIIWRAMPTGNGEIPKYTESERLMTPKTIC